MDTKFLLKVGKWVIFLIIFLQSGCKEDIIVPSQIVKQFGVGGIIMDTAGMPLDSVSIYCLYYQYYISYNSSYENKFQRLAKNDTFQFNLYQNFPNPFSRSTFIRFAIPKKSFIEFKIMKKSDSVKVYQIQDSLENGLYQMYLKDIVDSLQLLNGPYIYSLRALSTDRVEYYAARNMFIISGIGKPNVFTGVDGRYFFDYKMAYVGDTLIITYDGNYFLYYTLSNQVNFLVKRKGYRSRIISSEVYQGAFLNQDIILIKEEGL